MVDFSWELVVLHAKRFMFGKFLVHALEESLSITTLRCDLAIATHARKVHKKISI